MWPPTFVTFSLLRLEPQCAGFVPRLRSHNATGTEAPENVPQIIMRQSEFCAVSDADEAVTRLC